MGIFIKEGFVPVTSDLGVNIFGSINIQNIDRDVTVKITGEFLTDINTTEGLSFLEIVNNNLFSILSVAEMKIENSIETFTDSNPIIVNIISSDIQNYSL